ncbi:MAG: hypothetical protein Ct9H90mP5_04120 [Acidimicrobiaceae bacterium]|nr:MAG: hypothetical protein Ct9H90mP5_04120 [Acidimicrobiaceae bacterium]
MAVGGLTLFLVQGQEWGSVRRDTPFFYAYQLFQRPLANAIETPKTSTVSTSYISQRSLHRSSRVSVVSSRFFSIYFGLPLYMREVWSWSRLK